MILLKVRDYTGRLVSSCHHLLQESLVILCPFSNGKLRNHKCGVISTFDLTPHNVRALPLSSFSNDFTIKADEVRMHNLWLFTINHLAKIGNHFTWVVVLNCGRPTSANTVRAVDKNKRDHGHVVLWFD